MAYLDMTSGNSALKEFYGSQELADATYKDNPLWALVGKNIKGELVGGKYFPQPVRYSNPQGRSAVFATAQGQQTSSAMTSFFVTYARDYAVATMDGMTMRAMASDTGSFVRAWQAQIDPAHSQLVNDIAGSMYRDGTGIIGKIATGGLSTGVITLDDANTVTQFEPGMTLQACTTSDGSGIVAALGYVIKTSPSAGTITVSATATGAAGDPSGWDSTPTYPYLMVQGDAAAKISGLAAWIPAAAPGVTTFFGVNRSIQTTRLGGFRYDASTYSLEEGIIDALAKGAREGAMPDYLFCSFATFAGLEKSLHSKVEYIDLESEQGFGFHGLRIYGPRGELKVIPDRNCPGLVAYALDLDTVKLVSLGDVPHFLQEDDLMMLRVSNADAYEVRIGAYGNMVIDAPGRNINITTSV